MSRPDHSRKGITMSAPMERPEYGTPEEPTATQPQDHDQDDVRAGELATVRPLSASPDTHPDTEPDSHPDTPAVREVLEGRILSPARPGSVSGPVSGVRVVKAVITSERSVATSKVVA